MNKKLLDELLEKLGDPESREYKKLMAMPNNQDWPQTLKDIGLGHVGSADKGCWFLFKGQGYISSAYEPRDVIECYDRRPTLEDIREATGLGDDDSREVLLGNDVMCCNKIYQLKFKEFNNGVI